MRRRQFITLIGGAAVTWPLVVRAQQSGPKRRIGMLVSGPADNPMYKVGREAFRKNLEQLGWTNGTNVQIDLRYAENDGDRDRKFAAELVTLTPDVIVAIGTPSVVALQHATRALPIVFVSRMLWLHAFKLFHGAWKYAGVRDLRTIVFAVTFGDPANSSTIAIITAAKPAMHTHRLIIF